MAAERPKSKVIVNKEKCEEMLPLLKEAADRMREEWLETRDAVVNSGMRVEFFRGKDYSKFWLSNPDKLAYYLNQEIETTDAKQREEEASQMMVTLIGYLIAANLLKVADRKNHKPRPGKKKLSKFPSSLVTVSPTWHEDLFYTYTYERPRGAMFYVYAFLLLALAIFCSCYTIVPNGIKLALAYLSMFLLILMVGSLGLRSLIFLVVWILTGQSLWIFPNLLSDEVAITDCLVPRISIDPNSDDKSSLLKRGCVIALVTGIVFFLSEHGPDKAAVRMFTFKAHDQVLSMMLVKNHNMTMINDVTEDVHMASDADLDAKQKKQADNESETEDTSKEEENDVVYDDSVEYDLKESIRDDEGANNDL